MTKANSGGANLRGLSLSGNQLSECIRAGLRDVWFINPDSLGLPDC